MTAISRQNTLFVAEDWYRVYEALENVDFRAYDFDNLVEAMMNYIRTNYPEDFNDWVVSSELVMKIEVLAWLSQNISFRVDLNTRENFLATASRRDSLLRLAQNISYKVNRVRSASGEVKVTRIQTTEELYDSNNSALKDVPVYWNDPKNEDWYEQFILIMNAAFTLRTQFSRPLTAYRSGTSRVDQYLFNSIAPSSGVYQFNTTVNGSAMDFNIINGLLDNTDGVINERSPTNTNNFSIFYRLDGSGFSSSGSGFFLPFKQGNMAYQEENFNEAVTYRTVVLNASNINNDDFFVQELDASGNVLYTWEQVDTSYGESVSFNTTTSSASRIYEVETLSNDRVRVKFGDGKFGRMPVGRFRFWYRTANATPPYVRSDDIQNQTFVLNYVDSTGTNQYLTITYSLTTNVVNAAATESSFDVRTRANKVYYTQNRMITGQDYQNFFLNDNAIRKVKTVNRTFSGHSRYARLNDPTSLYQNTRVYGTDGRIYQDITSNVQELTADTDVLTNESIINQYIKPILTKEDKRQIYYSQYSELYTMSSNYTWVETENIDGQSLGYIRNNSVAVKVGPNGTGNLQYVGEDTVIRLVDPKGRLVVVDRVVDDGDFANGITLRETVETGTRIVSVFPSFRNRFTQSEALAIEEKLSDNVAFGLSWNQSEESWDIINAENLDETGEFSLYNQGDDTLSNLDSSWLIRMEFIPGQDDDDEWRLVDRGFGTFFESDSEVDFYFASNESTVDSETGRTVIDTIDLLSSNESRDSLRRRNLSSVGTGSCGQTPYLFVADGSTKCFQTREVPLDETNIVVLKNSVFQTYLKDYAITRDVTGDYVCFVNAPEDGDTIEVRVSGSLINAKITTVYFEGDGTTNEYDLFEDKVNQNNILAYSDGVMQSTAGDFGVGDNGVTNTIVYNDTPVLGSHNVVHVISGVDSNILSKYSFTADGVTNDYDIAVSSQTNDTLMLFIDGVMQAPDRAFTIDSTGNSGTTVRVHDTPSAGARVRIIASTNPLRMSSANFVFDADGAQTTFTLGSLIGVNEENLIVSIDGILQNGPYANEGVWSVTGQNTLVFNAPPYDGAVINVFAILGAAGSVITDGTEDSTDEDEISNDGDLTVSSCHVSFVGQDVPLYVEDVLRHDDGYINPNGLFVKPADLDRSGFYDNPFIFRDLVLQDGYTDLVLWRKVVDRGFSVWEPIGDKTSPKGTYGSSKQFGHGVGDEIDAETTSDGDIHYDLYTDTWLIANGTDDVWEEAPDQSLFRYAIGRGNLKFMWTHYSPDTYRIDPSVSNIMDAYILTSTYDDAYRDWLESNGSEADKPIPPTSESLRVQFTDYEDFKAKSDAIVYHSSRFKPLFGQQAISELQGTFKIIQTDGSNLSDNDLKLQVLSTIEDYFSVNNWDFGETFYFSELGAYLHQRLASDIRTVVLVPKNNDQPFGRMYQVRSEPDELFVSAASPNDIELVANLTDEELRVGTLLI